MDKHRRIRALRDWLAFNIGGVPALGAGTREPMDAALRAIAENVIGIVTAADKRGSPGAAKDVACGEPLQAKERVRAAEVTHWMPLPELPEDKV